MLYDNPYHHIGNSSLPNNLSYEVWQGYSIPEFCPCGSSAVRENWIPFSRSLLLEQQLWKNNLLRDVILFHLCQFVHNLVVNCPCIFGISNNTMGVDHKIIKELQ